MINLYSGELRDILPPYFKYKADIISYSAALKEGLLLVHEYAERTLLYADIDNMPEYLLDYAAIELDAQYYNSTDDIDKKREYIKKALYWKIKAGTIEAVEELIRTAFGEGTIKIWKDYDEGEGTPGTFRIETNADITAEIVDTFISLIERTKNESSHLETVSANREVNTELMVATAQVQDSEQYLTNDININNPDAAYIYEMYAAIYDFAEGLETLVLSTTGTDMTVNETFSCGFEVVQDSEQTIGG